MTIVTQRTLLVPYTEELESDFVMLNVCAKNRQHMNGAHTVDSARALFQKVLTDKQQYAFAVLDIRTRDFIGHVFISLNEPTAELGYLFDKKYWRQGYATEVLSAFVPEAMKALSLSALCASVDIGHTASLRLLDKLGFDWVSEASDEFGPYLNYQFIYDAEEDGSSAHESLSSPVLRDTHHLQAQKTQIHK
ncbi:GNAT family N-acetyltransferase [Vibrio hippocampi]|uniref:N-acetyltransferase domain-containing protein n=1 Tax=Vibrio hippocampi TaxID=654686 RepID=A0ABM8ZIN7_9VIBR|nr:GNAT family N-acetyltransferase [Vibrio hippocampi]CAH0526698.1 hypothetical protein VHP8226_02070 [Vibrio hippocampi]